MTDLRHLRIQSNSIKKDNNIEMNKVGFVVNGRRSIVRNFQRSFDKYSKKISGEYNVLITSERGHAKALARELSNDFYTHVIAVGGDGTLHEVVNGLKQAANEECTLGLLPYGTANDYSKTIQVTKNWSKMVDLLNRSESRPVNLGEVTLASDQKEFFINIADMGLGVDVVQRVNQSARWLGPSLTFSKAIVQSFLKYENQEILVKADDWSWEGKVNSFVIAIGKFFGSGMCIAPDAEIDNDSFSVVIIGDIKVRDYLRYIGKIKKGIKIDHPEVQYRKTRGLQLECHSGIEADGEFIGLQPKSVRLIPGSLSFLA